MGSGNSIRLGNIFGIRIGVDPSWFIILFLLIWLLSDYYEDALPGASMLTSYALAAASALLFFFSIVLHELGHALVAIRNKIGIAGIDLWLFGGVAKMNRDTTSPGVEFRIAAAGPVVTLLIVALCGALGASLAGWDKFSAAMEFDPAALDSGSLAMLAYLASVNAIVFIFNMIPAFPLDGGRIARSIAWKITGNRSSATRFAATMGRGFAYFLIGIGIIAVVKPDIIGYRVDLIGGIWFVFMGFFLNQAAKSAEQQDRLTSKIEGVTVADVMDREPVAVSAQMPVSEAYDHFFLRYRYPWFPVIDGLGHYVGLIDSARIETLPEGDSQGKTIEEIMRSDNEGEFKVEQDEPLESLLGNTGIQKLGALIAVDGSGQMRGLVTIDDVRRALTGVVL